jgi:hypothetical protein
MNMGMVTRIESRAVHGLGMTAALIDFADVYALAIKTQSPQHVRFNTERARACTVENDS